MNSDNIKASVIILAYNHSQTIVRAIDSVLGQRTDFKFEIVIAEDASTDDTRDICNEYARKYPEIIRLLPEAPNKGLVDNYFDALMQCRGEYAGDCAGDDEWIDAGRLQQQADILDSKPDDIAVISDWFISSDDSDISSSEIKGYSRYRHSLTGREMLLAVLGTRRHFPLLSAMLFRVKPLREVLELNPECLRRAEWGCEDLPLIAMLGQLGNIAYLPLKAARYYINPEGITNSADAGKTFDFYIKAAKCVVDLCEIHRVKVSEIREALDARTNYLAYLLLNSYTPERYDKFRRLCVSIPECISPKTGIYLRLMPSASGRSILKTLKQLKARIRKKTN